VKSLASTESVASGIKNLCDGGYHRFSISAHLSHRSVSNLKAVWSSHITQSIIWKKSFTILLFDASQK